MINRHSESVADKNASVDSFISKCFRKIAKSRSTNREKPHGSPSNGEWGAVQDSVSSNDQCNKKPSLSSIDIRATPAKQNEEKSNNTMTFNDAVSDLLDPIAGLMFLDMGKTVSGNDVNRKDSDKVSGDATGEMPFNGAESHVLESTNMESDNSSKYTPPSASTDSPYNIVSTVTPPLRESKPSCRVSLGSKHKKGKESRATNRERSALLQETAGSTTAKASVSRRSQNGNATPKTLQTGSTNQTKSKRREKKKLSSIDPCVHPNTKSANPSHEVELVLKHSQGKI